MNDPQTAEIQGKLTGSIALMKIDTANVACTAQLVSDLITKSCEGRKKLIAEARGILERYGVIDSRGDGASLVMIEYNRLCEILDELEKLP